MILTTLTLFCCVVLPADTPRAVPSAPAVELHAAANVPAPEARSEKPDTPMPKIMASSNEDAFAAEPPLPSGKIIASAPIRPANTEVFETRRKRVIWYSLAAATHGTAAFDAWTTRRAITGGYGVESDPLQRPFAHSGAIYATTQVSPLLMDYVGRRMMRSRSPLLRRFWWLPQTASASFSLGAGIHNYHVVH